MAGIASKPLTVDVHETGVVSAVNRENQVGPWYTRSDDAKQQLGAPWGPANPQALNRYSSVLNGPLTWTDPSGHYVQRGDQYYGYESVCGADGKARCTGENDYVDSQGKRYVRVWITNLDGTRSEKIVEETSYEFQQFDKMLSDYITHMGQLEEAITALAIALIVVAAACLTPAAPTPACPVALATALAADATVIRAQSRVDADSEALRRNFMGLKTMAYAVKPRRA